MTQFSIDRRSLFKGAGALVVSIGIPGGVATAEIGSAVKPPLSPDRLDSWLAVNADGSVVAYFGKMDMGQGVDVAIAQIVGEELDVPFEQVNVVMGDTAWTVNQGGASGSTGIQKGGIPLRNAAAEARRVLVELASQRLSVPADRLEVTDGVVAVTKIGNDLVGHHLSGHCGNHHRDWYGVCVSSQATARRAATNAALRH